MLTLHPERRTRDELPEARKSDFRKAADLFTRAAHLRHLADDWRRRSEDPQINQFAAATYISCAEELDKLTGE